MNLKDDLSNSIQIKKNNKIIFMNTFLFKNKNKKKEICIEKKKRSSIYRGVSKNGSNWQVIIHHKNNNRYIGVFKTQEIAARVYDIISIKNQGIKAKTNFQYNIHQIQNIIEAYIDYNSEKIEEIIYDLISQ